MRGVNKIGMMVISIVILSGIFFSFQYPSEINKNKSIKTSKYCIIGYIFARDKVLPENIAVEKMTHINYSFGYIKDGLFYTPSPKLIYKI